MGYRLSCIPYDHGSYSLNVDNILFNKINFTMEEPANPQPARIPGCYAEMLCCSGFQGIN